MSEQTLTNEKINDLFHPRRFLSMTVFDTRKALWPLLIKAGAVLGVLLVVSLVNHFFRQYMDYFEMYGALFFILGCLITASSFRGYYSRRHSSFMLMLPASRLEKWLEKFLLSTLGWMIFSFLAFTVYTYLSAGLGKLFFDFYTPPAWWSRYLGQVYLSYLAFHGVFFAGASIFKKSPLFKTILTLFGLFAFFMIVWTVFARVLLGPEITRLSHGVFWEPFEDYLYRFAFSPEMDNIRRFGNWAGRLLGWVIVPLYCWTLSFVRFREIEEKDAV